jgi:RimJ/RimL family protein N-acetyltransferase
LLSYSQMSDSAIRTTRLDLRPLPPAAAGALPDDRATAARLLGAALPPDWPQVDLLDVLPLQARAAPDEERFGVWVMIERESKTVTGDIGFLGPPGEDGSVGIGFSVVPDRRGRGYATEAARALVDWALRQPGVVSVVAGCDTGNVPSIRTLERIGFVRTGESDGRLSWRHERPQAEQGRG